MSYNAQDSPAIKHYLAQNVSSAELEKHALELQEKAQPF